MADIQTLNVNGTAYDIFARGLYGYSYSVTVDGDKDTYYPVVISTTTSKRMPNIITISKDLGTKTASYPGNHSNGTSSCLYRYEVRNQLWDGNGGYCKCLHAWYGYAQLVAEATMLNSSVGNFCIWLRGGGTSYNIYTTFASSATPFYSNTNVGSSTYPTYVEPRTTIGNGGSYSNTPIGYGSISGTASYASRLGDSDAYHTKASLDTALNGKSNTGHTHSYLPLSGGTMSNQNVVVNLNADLLDGYSGSAYAKKTDLASYLPLTGGTVTGPIEISTGNTNNTYNEGLRITRANNDWAGITLGSTGLSGAPDDGWFIATNPSTDFIISPNNSYDHVGLKLVDAGNAYWRNNIILHSGNIESYALTSKPSYSWSEINNKPSTFTPSSHSHNYLSAVPSTLGQTTFSCSSYPQTIMNSTSGSEANIRFDMSGTQKGFIGYINTHGTFLYNCAARKYLAINDSGVAHVSGTTISLEGHTHNYAPSTHYHSYLPLSGGTLSGSLEIFASGSAWNEGIRIHPSSNNWSGIVFCESSNSGSSNSSTNTWSIHNNEGTFGMFKNGSTKETATTYISNVSNSWYIGGNTEIKGTCKATGFYNSSGTSVSYEGHTHNYAATTHYHSYLPLSGGTMSTPSSWNINFTNNGTWTYNRYSISSSVFWDAAVCNTDSGTIAGKYGFEVRESGLNKSGISVRYGTSSYGKLVVSNDTNNETSIGFLNHKHSATIPVWTVGTSIGDGAVTTFGWFYYNTEAKMWLTHTGNLTVKGGFYQSSDERLKTFYDPIKVDLDKLKTLRKNYFKFNDKDKLEIGVSAQEVQEIYPELVTSDDNGYLSVAYDKLSVIALKAIDELDNKYQKEINDLNDQLSTIKNILKEKGIL